MLEWCSHDPAAQKHWNRHPGKWDNKLNKPSIAAAFDARTRVREGGLMLATRQRFARNPYFHFHPLHTMFALLGALILFGLLVWFLAVPAH